MASYRITNSDGLCVVRVDGPPHEAATEVQHYLHMYQDELPLSVEVRKGRKWERLFVVAAMAPQPRVVEHEHPAMTHDVEQRAREAGHSYAQGLPYEAVKDRTGALALAAHDYAEGYLKGHADRATADQAALQAAHALLEEVLHLLSYMSSGSAREMCERIEDYFAAPSRGQEPPP